MSDLTTRTPLAEQVASELVRRIVANEYTEGAMIPPESELAEDLVVGRSTVREAMKVLVGAGLVEIRRGRGTCVRPRAEWSPFDPIVLAARAAIPGEAHETTLKVLEARQLVEVGVAELAARRATPEQVERLDQLIAEMESAGDVDTFVTADLAFHNTLLEAADNPFVSTLFAPIDALLSEERRRTSEPASLRPAAIAAHRAIADAVRRRDPVAARTEMTQHLEQTGQKMEALWAEADGD